DAALIGEQKQRRAAEQAESHAIDAAARAQIEAKTAEQVSDFLVHIFQMSDPFSVYSIREADGSSPATQFPVGTGPGAMSAGEILHRGAKRVSEELSDQPEVQLRLLIAIADAFYSLQMLTEAQATAEAAIVAANRVPTASGHALAEVRAH